MGNPVESLFIKVYEGAAALMKAREKSEVIQDALLLGKANHLYQPKHVI